MGKAQKKTGKGRIDKYYKLAKSDNLFPSIYNPILTIYLENKDTERVQRSNWFNSTKNMHSWNPLVAALICVQLLEVGFK